MEKKNSLLSELESSERARGKWRKCWECCIIDLLAILQISSDGLRANVGELVVGNTSKWFKLTSFQPHCVDKNRHPKKTYSPAGFDRELRRL